MVVDTDSQGKEIYLGDRVIKWWMVSNGVNHYRLHTIKYADHKFKLSPCENKWEGKRVTLIPKEEWGKYPADGELFYFQNGKIMEGIYFSEEEKEIYKRIQKEVDEKLMARLLGTDPPKLDITDKNDYGPTIIM